MKTRNSDRLKEILGAKRNQIVALKDIQMYLLETNPEVATKISYQIDREEEVYKNLLKVIELAENSEPKRNGWFSGHIKTKTHQKWIADLNANKMNYFSENVRLNETVHNQKIIISKLQRENDENLKLIVP